MSVPLGSVGKSGVSALITIDKADTPDLPALPSGTDTVPHVLDIPPAGQGDPEWVPISDGAVPLAALSDTNIDPTSITTNHVLGWDEVSGHQEKMLIQIH